jgi:GTP-binding nuclear protein Ran
MSTKPFKPLKIALVGDGGVGKTCMLKMLAHDLFEKKYIATIGVDVSPIDMCIDGENIVFNVWDCAGQEKFGGLRDGYWLQSDGVIIMSDATSRLTDLSVETWKKDVRRVLGNNIPIVVVQNKIDILDRKSGCDNYDIQISVKRCVNLAKPFERLYAQISQNAQ